MAQKFQNFNHDNNNNISTPIPQSKPSIYDVVDLTLFNKFISKPNDKVYDGDDGPLKHSPINKHNTSDHQSQLMFHHNFHRHHHNHHHQQQQQQQQSILMPILVHQHHQLNNILPESNIHHHTVMNSTTTATIDTSESKQQQQQQQNLTGIARLLNDLQRLLGDNESADIVFLVGSNELPVYAHRAILQAR